MRRKDSRHVDRSLSWAGRCRAIRHGGMVWRRYVALGWRDGRSLVLWDVRGGRLMRRVGGWRMVDCWGMVLGFVCVGFLVWSAILDFGGCPVSGAGTRTGSCMVRLSLVPVAMTFRTRVLCGLVVPVSAYMLYRTHCRLVFGDADAYVPVDVSDVPADAMRAGSGGGYVIALAALWMLPVIMVGLPVLGLVPWPSSIMTVVLSSLLLYLALLFSFAFNGLRRRRVLRRHIPPSGDDVYVDFLPTDEAGR